MTYHELQLPLPGPRKIECNGDRESCSGDLCPIYGTPMARSFRDGRERVRGCDDVAARGRRNRAKGDRRERGVAKKLLATRTTRHEELRGGPIRYESKAGGKAKTVQTAYRNSRAQSDAARAVGDNRPFIAAFAPDGDGHEYLVIRDDDLYAVACAVVEGQAAS